MEKLNKEQIQLGRKLIKRLNQARNILAELHHNFVNLNFNEAIEQIDEEINNIKIVEETSKN